MLEHRRDPGENADSCFHPSRTARFDRPPTAIYLIYLAESGPKIRRLLSASGVMEACGGGFRYDDGFRRSAVAGEHGGPVIMATVDPVNLASLLEDAKCFALVRQHRWPEGVRCPGCDSDAVVRNGHDETQPHRQRYRCQACASRFDDLSGTLLAGHHQPLRIWVLCLYFMGLNLSNRQTAAELG